MTDPETPSPVFVDPSGRRRRMLIVILAVVGSVVVGYLRPGSRQRPHLGSSTALTRPPAAARSVGGTLLLL